MLCLFSTSVRLIIVKTSPSLSDDKLIIYSDSKVICIKHPSNLIMLQTSRYNFVLKWEFKLKYILNGYQVINMSFCIYLIIKCGLLYSKCHRLPKIMSRLLMFLEIMYYVFIKFIMMKKKRDQLILFSEFILDLFFLQNDMHAGVLFQPFVIR